MQTSYFLVALQENERPAEIADMLTRDFGVRATVATSTQQNATFKVEGVPGELFDVALWHACLTLTE